MYLKKKLIKNKQKEVSVILFNTESRKLPTDLAVMLGWGWARGVRVWRRLPHPSPWALGVTLASSLLRSVQKVLGKARTQRFTEWP